ncbi:hypothetical protein ILUMI_19906 [Ignelater luminosus]|uniref:Uncharacterized protein n=1 Tax=Ignelater luminosus TaxID=2038154 RepID=A0A8K0CM09_IGNLU|nr:hypothetical protein ILUMI_19906 [Ignelater luminosus]
MYLLAVTTFFLMLTVSKLIPLDSIKINCKEHTNGEINDCKHTIESQESSKGRSLDYPDTFQSNYKPEEHITQTNSSEDEEPERLLQPAVNTLAGGGLGR